MASPPVIDNHPIFTTAAYSAASVAALWGIIEIFLRIDPFFLVYLKHAFSLGIGLMAMAVAGLIYTYISTFIPKTQAKKNNENCKKNPSRGTLYFFSILPLISLLLAIIFDLLYVSKDFPPVNSPLLWILYFILMLSLSLAAIYCLLVLCQKGTDREFSNKSRPSTDEHMPFFLSSRVLVPLFIVGLMALLVSLGRSQDIRESDIAQEELRQAGLSFSMASLQSAIYLLSPRSIELFRRANIDNEDIFFSLGQPVEGSNNEPLINMVLRRIDTGDIYCDDENMQGSTECLRVRKFLETLDPNFFSDNQPTNCALFHDEISLSQNLNQKFTSLPLLSHAILNGNEALMRSLIERCGINPLMSYFPYTMAESTVRQDAWDQPQSETTLQTHIVATLDPHLAIAAETMREGGQWTKEEAKPIHESLCHSGLEFRNLVEYEIPEGCRQDSNSTTANSTKLDSLPDRARRVTMLPDSCKVEDYGISYTSHYSNTYPLPDDQETLITINTTSGKLSPLDNQQTNISEPDPATAIIMQRLNDTDNDIDETSRNGIQPNSTRLVTLQNVQNRNLPYFHAYNWTPDTDDGTWTTIDHPANHPLSISPSVSRFYIWKDENSEETSTHDGKLSIDTPLDWSLDMENSAIFSRRIQLDEEGSIRFSSLSADDLGCLSLYQVGDDDELIRVPDTRLGTRDNAEIGSGDEGHQEWTTQRLPQGDYQLDLTLFEPKISTGTGDQSDTLGLSLDTKKPWALYCSIDGQTQYLSAQSVPPLLTPGKIGAAATIDGKSSQEISCQFNIDSFSLFTATVSSSADVTLNLLNSKSEEIFDDNIDDASAGTAKDPAVETASAPLQKGGPYQLLIRPYLDSFDESDVSIRLLATEPIYLPLDLTFQSDAPLESQGNFFYKAETAGTYHVRLDNMTADLDLYIRKDGDIAAESTNADNEEERATFCAEVDDIFEIEVVPFGEPSDFHLVVEKEVNESDC